MNEDSILRKIREWCETTQNKSTLIGIGDDAAAIQSHGGPIIFCSDMSIENVHFNLHYSSTADVGYKALARVLSDIAAMGAAPLGVTVSIAVPTKWVAAETEKFLEGFYHGAIEISRDVRAPIAGGDLSRIDGPISIDVAAIGETKSLRDVWRRSTAQAGDRVFVSGELGAAAFALGEMNSGQLKDLDPKIAAKHFRPRPRFDVAEKFREAAAHRTDHDCQNPVHAAIDISDGLVRDAHRVCKESNVSMALAEEKIPRSHALDFALNGGDDYELLLCVDANWAGSLTGAREIAACGLIEIGRVEAPSVQGNAIWLVASSGERLVLASESVSARGHDPFRDANNNQDP